MAGYTRLAPSTPTPPAEAVSRAEWASVNLDALSHILDPVAARLDDRLAFAGPLAGALRAGASATLAAEAGLVMGYLSSRVLGQYDVSLLGGDTEPRLLFVGQNLAERSATWTWTPTPSAAGSARTSSRTCSSSRGCRGFAST